MSETNSAGADMRSYIQRVATGPELSKSLSQPEARTGMRHILEKSADPVHAAVRSLTDDLKGEFAMTLSLTIPAEAAGDAD